MSAPESAALWGRGSSAPGPPEEASERHARDRGLPVRLGVLTAEIGPGLVDLVVAAAGRVERRSRLLPARSVVYFVLALCLFSGADSMGPPGYRSVMRWLTNGLRHLQGCAVPTSPALTKARRRLGAEPLRLLFAHKKGPLAAAGTPGAFAFGLRLVAWDGWMSPTPPRTRRRSVGSAPAATRSCGCWRCLSAARTR